jgi:predicted secreted protein
MQTPSLSVLALIVIQLMVGPGAADPATPFNLLPGRWVGQGRLGLQGVKIEIVKCRATYFTSDDGSQLKQNVRCASQSGKIEVKSLIAHSGGELSGTWNELVYNLGGELSGNVTERGFRISVRGSGLTANMEVAVAKSNQIIEIQFFDSTLLGLSLVLRKG